MTAAGKIRTEMKLKVKVKIGIKVNVAAFYRIVWKKGDKLRAMKINDADEKN